MQELATSQKFDSAAFPQPLDENDHLIAVQKCAIRRKKLIPEGELTTLNLKEAVALLAPSGRHFARINVMKLKPGHFIGVKAGDLSNFVIINPTKDGDIRWLLRKNPNLPVLTRDIYYVESITVRRNTIDLPMSADGDQR